MDALAHDPTAPLSASSIDMASLLRGIWRRRLTILLLSALFALAAVAYVATATPTYIAEAMVLIDNLDTPFDRVQPGDAQARQGPDERDVLSQVSVITSRDLAGRVIDKLGLVKRPEFDPLSKGIGLAGRVAIALGFKPDPRSQPVEDRAYSRYSGNLNVYQVPNSKVIVIRYSSTDPKTAADVANALAETYVMSTREAESEPTSRAREWLAHQIDSLRTKVVEAEAAAEEFRARAGLLKGTQATLGAQELQELNSQIVLAQAQRSEAQAKARAIRDLLARNGNVDASSDVLSSPLIQRLREEQTALNRTKTELAVTYLPSHPKMVAVTNQLANIGRQIKAEAMHVVDALEDQAKVAQSRQQSLQASLSAAKSKASETNQDEVKLRALEREAAANRELFETFLNRYTDASTRQDLSAQPGMARVIQRATVPSTPAYPLPGPTVILASLAGLMLGLGLAFLAEVMAASSAIAAPPAFIRPPQFPVLESRFRAPRAAGHDPAVSTPEPPSRATEPVVPIAFEQKPENDLPELHPSDLTTPSAESDLAPAFCELPACVDATSAISNAYQPIANPDAGFSARLKLIASWMMSARQTLGVNCLALMGVGNSVFDVAAAAAGLSRSLASENVRVLLVDADPASAVLQVVLGLPSGPGLSELLVGEVPFEATIARDPASDVQILRVGQNRAAISSFAQSDRLDSLFDALAQVYDVIIVHCGSADGSARSAASRCDAAVVLAGSESLAEAVRVIAQLRKAGLTAAQFLRINRPFEKRAAA
jgi:uncharacterized protein involved in exopolysaccharide biosynthesis